MKVDFVDLKRQYQEIKPEIDTAIATVIAESSFIRGKHLKAFENAFAAFTDCNFCIGVGNGTDALYVALRTLGVGPGDEVLTPANTFIATSEAVTMTGAKVRFVDCHPGTYTIDVEKLAEAITPATKAIVPVHLYGQPADMDPIMALAKKHGLFVVEDAAQAHGATYHGRKIGSIGDMGCFSFFPGKNLGAYGDGGAITTKDESLAQKARMVANHGRISKYDHEFEGINSRLDGLQAAILSAKLPHLEAWNDRRRAVAAIYDRELTGVVPIPKQLPEVRHVYHLYVVQVPERDAIQAELKEKGIATGIHYPMPLPYLMAYASLGHAKDDFPVAYAAHTHILSLPMHGSMTDDEAVFVAASLKDALAAHQPR